MSEPGIILIGGPPGAGKTTLGRALAKRLGFTSLTGDDLAITARVLTTEESQPALHQMREVGHTAYFTDGPPEKLVSDAVALEDTLWPAIERVVARHLSLDSTLVFDWWLLSPQAVAELADTRIRSIWLHIDPTELERRERLNQEFLAGSTDPEQMLSNFMSRSLWRNDLVASEAEQLGLPVVHQDGHQTVEDLVETAREAIATP